MSNDPCERCGARPHSWFTDGGYLCNPCMDELYAFRTYLVDVFAPLHKLPVWRGDSGGISR